MIFEMNARHYQRTGDECPVCDNGELLSGDNERFCDECYTVIDSDAFDHTTVDPWEDWWDHRSECYDGIYGPERIKPVGGFEGIWFYSDDEYVL